MAPAVLAHDAVDGRQAEPGALRRAPLVVKNGSKRCAADLRGHAAPGVGHREPDVGAGAQPPPCAADLGPRRGRVARGEVSMPPAAGHRVAGVDGQVDEHLLDLAGIGPDRRGAGRQVGDEVDVLADQAAQHLLDPGHGVVQVERRAARSPACALKARSWRVRSAARAAGRPDRPRRSLLGRHRRAGRRRREQRRVAADGGEEVVEVVGDAAGEPADGSPSSAPGGAAPRACARW